MVILLPLYSALVTLLQYILCIVLLAVAVYIEYLWIKGILFLGGIIHKHVVMRVVNSIFDLWGRLWANTMIRWLEARRPKKVATQ